MKNTVPAADPFFDDLTPEEMKIIGYLLCGFNQEEILQKNLPIDKKALSRTTKKIFRKNGVKTQAQLQAVYFGPISEEIFFAKALNLGLKERQTNAVRLLLRGDAQRKIRQTLGVRIDKQFLTSCYSKLGIQKAEEIFVLFHGDSVGPVFPRHSGGLYRNKDKESEAFHQRARDYFNQLAKGKLTSAELQTIPYILEGLTCKMIAGRIAYVSYEGYASRLASIFRKCRELGLDNITSKEKLQAHFYSSAYVWNEEKFQQKCAEAKLDNGVKRVVRGLLGGKANIEIADSLGISPETVNDYIKVVHKALNIHSRKKIFAVFYGEMEPIELMGPLKESSPQVRQQPDTLTLSA